MRAGFERAPGRAGFTIGIGAFSPFQIMAEYSAESINIATTISCYHRAQCVIAGGLGHRWRRVWPISRGTACRSHDARPHLCQSSLSLLPRHRGINELPSPGAMGQKINMRLRHAASIFRFLLLPRVIVAPLGTQGWLMLSWPYCFTDCCACQQINYALAATARTWRGSQHGRVIAD